jgi:hypothetical protein
MAQKILDKLLFHRDAPVSVSASYPRRENAAGATGARIVNALLTP